MHSRLKNIVGENNYALLRSVYRFLGRVVSFFKGCIPYRSTRRTVLKDYDGSLLLLYKDANDESPLIAGGDHEMALRSLFKTLIKPGDTVLDVGANSGIHSVLFSKLCGPDGAVHSFEPVDYNIKKLNANLRLNRCDNTVLHDYALGEAECKKSIRKIRETEYFKGNSSLVDNEKIDGELNGKYEYDEIRVRQLDDVVEEFQLKVDLIKMDVEGYEYQVLQGAGQTMRQHLPTIIMEYGTQRLKHLGITNNDFEQLLGDLYDCHEICVANTYERYASLEPFRFDRDMSFGNLLLIPKHKPISPDGISTESDRHRQIAGADASFASLPR